MNIRRKPSQSFLVVCYKLAAEFLMLILASSLLFFIAEMALPGFVSARINFSTPYLLITFFLLPLVLLHRFLPDKPEARSSAPGTDTPSLSPVTLALLSLLFVFLLMNDMHGLPLVTSALILILLFFVIFFMLSAFVGRSQEPDR